MPGRHYFFIHGSPTWYFAAGHRLAAFFFADAVHRPMQIQMNAGSGELAFSRASLQITKTTSFFRSMGNPGRPRTSREKIVSKTLDNNS